MKTTVQVKGESVEVDIPGVIAEADVSAKYTPNDAVTRIVQDRLAQFGKSHVSLDDITAKPEVKQKVLDLLGVKAGSEAAGDVGKQLEGAKKQWAETELRPVAEQLQSSKTEIEALRRDRLTDQIVAAAARVGVKAPLLNPPVPGAKPAIVAMLEQAFAFDDKTRQWYARGANTDQPFAFSAQPTGAQPYKTVEELMGDWSKTQANKEFVGSTMQGGPGLQNGGSGQGGVGFISQADARNPTKYRVAKAAADKAGVELQFSD